MEFLSSARDRATSDAAIDRWQTRIGDQGWSFRAVKVKESGVFIGMAGLQVPAPPHPYLPCVEIDWRLARASWVKGYATEAARRALRFAFEDHDLQEVVATTAQQNVRSSAVMQRLGMSGPEGLFMRPGVPERSVLRQHVLYRLARGTFHTGESDA
jgi:RimJ/RimL family protein N-acetyltransferase